MYAAVHFDWDTLCSVNAANLKRKLCGIPLIKLCKNGLKHFLKARPFE